MATALKFWAVLVAVLYAALAYGSYVTLPSLAGGLPGFDMRPLGLSGSEAEAYLATITEAGRDYYRTWLNPLDHVFIAALTSLCLMLAWRVQGVCGAIAGLAALGYATADIVENALVRDILLGGVATADQIAAATRVKFVCLAITGAALLLGWKRKPHHA